MATVAFDLVGTLVDPGALAEAWPEAGRSLGLAALDETIAMAMVDTLTGVFRPFPELMRGALPRRAVLAGLELGALDAALERLGALPPYPDARVALERAHADGHRVCVLTNSAREKGRALLDQAGLLDAVEEVHGADAVEVYKPHPKVYGLLDADWLVAGHWWDCAGAARAGYRTAFVTRDERLAPPTAPAFDVVADDLLSAVSAIAAAA